MVTYSWQQKNWDKYQCPVCKMNTFHKAKYHRHLGTKKHFLMTLVRGAPRDLKILIGEFLPVRSLRRLPFRAFHDIMYRKLVASPLAQIYAEGALEEHKRPSRASSIQLFELCRYHETSAVRDWGDGYLLFS